MKGVEGEKKGEERVNHEENSQPQGAEDIE